MTENDRISNFDVTLCNLVYISNYIQENIIDEISSVLFIRDYRNKCVLIDIHTVDNFYIGIRISDTVINSSRIDISKFEIDRLIKELNSKIKENNAGTSITSSESNENRR